MCHLKSHLLLIDTPKMMPRKREMLCLARPCPAVQTAWMGEKPAMMLVDGEVTLQYSDYMLRLVGKVSGRCWTSPALSNQSVYLTAWIGPYCNITGFCMFVLLLLFSFIVINPVNNAVKAKQRGKGKRSGKRFQMLLCAHVWSMSLYLGCFNASLDLAC